jgi:16S rRNA (cytosine1402-N4)-methyltransferase
MISAHGHDPVLLNAVLNALDPHPGDVALDCTVGRGGHALAIARQIAPNGTLLALDVDPDNLAYARDRLAHELAAVAPAMRFFHASFGEVTDAMDAAAVEKADVILADLGVSTNQLFDTHYGLSFAEDSALDMRLDPRIKRTAADLLAELSERELADLIFHNADERGSFKIARKIVQTRSTQPIRTTDQLARLIRSVLGPRKTGQIDPATRTFQALRMAVNSEMENLEVLLDALPDLARIGTRIAIISFHSGEDRRVKHAMKQWAADGRCELLTKKPIEPDEKELYENPRSRSAKLRAVKWIT